MLILDTDLLSMIQRGAGEAYIRLNARLETASELHVVGVTVISLEEQLRGWLAHIAKSRPLQRQIDAYLRLHTMVDDYAARYLVDFDEEATRRYQGLVRARVRIGTMDLKIAAIALAQRATLLSRNLSDFRQVPGLTVEDWSAP